MATVNLNGMSPVEYRAHYIKILRKLVQLFEVSPK